MKEEFDIKKAEFYYNIFLDTNININNSYPTLSKKIDKVRNLNDVLCLFCSSSFKNQVIIVKLLSDKLMNEFIETRILFNWTNQNYDYIFYTPKIPYSLKFIIEQSWLFIKNIKSNFILWRLIQKLK